MADEHEHCYCTRISIQNQFNSAAIAAGRCCWCGRLDLPKDEPKHGPYRAANNLVPRMCPCGRGMLVNGSHTCRIAMKMDG